MSTQAALDAALADLAAGRLPDEAGRRLVMRAARDFMQTPSRSRAALFRQEGLRQRDQILCEIATRYCGGLKGVKPKADKIAAWARTYEGTAWIRDKHASSCPDRLRKRPEGLIWRAFKACSKFPRDRQLREIIARATL